MTSTAEKLYESALALPEEDREALALRILDTLPRMASSEVSAAWRDEVVRRVGQVRRGEVETESLAEVEAHLDSVLSR